MRSIDVCFWGKADIQLIYCDVCFWPKAGHWRLRTTRRARPGGL